MASTFMKKTPETFGKCVALLAALTAPTVWAAENDSDIPARQEVTTIHSKTLTDQQFLNGDKGGSDVVLGGVLSLPQGEGTFPVVILQHGSGGVGSNITYWQRTFNAAGIATFAMDGFTGRGIVSTSADQAQLGRLNFILDDYNAGALLAKHPRIDPKRIILMGFSRGGQASLYASLERFDKMWKSADYSFAGYIAFYPDCATDFKDQDVVMKRPIRVFHGLADNYDPFSVCEPYFKELKKKGIDIAYHTYEGANHVFDSPYTWSPVREAKTSQSVRDCKIVEASNGQLINEQTGKPFQYTDACVAKGARVGPNAEAAAQATTDVLAAVKEMLSKP
ncbi:dienelactone hydrolase family protein [Pseudomonas batumici]|uniref:dienelactone hydrolase family protein n=1 Tax=Pseudomonas batumici TaxID=226910 RepID=UPI0030CBB860